MYTVTDILRGMRKADIVEKGYDRLKTFGVGHDLSNAEWNAYLLQMLQICNRKAWFCREELNVPIFLLSGSEDPVGNYGKGVQEICKKLLRYGKNAQMKLYPNCRHEVLNDTCRDEVIRDILVFAER
jgi:alpha-beta hydrolase superfamily lysophospholipase